MTNNFLQSFHSCVCFLLYQTYLFTQNIGQSCLLTWLLRILVIIKVLRIHLLRSYSFHFFCIHNFFTLFPEEWQPLCKLNWATINIIHILNQIQGKSHLTPFVCGLLHIVINLGKLLSEFHVTVIWQSYCRMH